MKARFAFLLTLAVLTAGALALRLLSRDVRPFHADESVHAVKFREIWEHGVYRYDPNEFHGPTLYYAALPVVKFFHRRNFADTREGDYRLVTALFGAALLPLVAFFSDGLGKRAALIGALLCGISPAFVFYSRYYIQEAPLAFFTLGCLGCAWRYRQNPHFGWAAGAGLCAGLMIATKETAILSFAAALAAYALTKFLARRAQEKKNGATGGVAHQEADDAMRGVPQARDRTSPAMRRSANPSAGREMRRGPLGLAIGTALAAAILFLSGFGSNWRGPLDYFRAYTPWLKRAGETELHRHGAGYYLEILCWSHAPGRAVYSEGLIVGLAIVGIVAAFANRAKCSVPRSGLLRFVAIYTVFLTAAYSAIPYKTPWCVLTFLTGMVLLAGVGADILLRIVPVKIGKAVVAMLLLSGAVQLEGQAKRASFTAYADPNNPYVYAQTAPDALNLYQRMNAFAEASPQHNQTIIKVISTDGYYWPLPWYLRRFDPDSVGYYNGIPADATAPIVIASSELDEELTKRLGDNYIMTGYTGLRPGVTYETFVRMDLWAAYLQWKKANGKQDDD